MIKVFSYGGGVQSTAALVLASQGAIDYTTFLFCNVGDDSEHPDTLTYVREIAKPYALAHGIELLELNATRYGEPDTLYGRLTRPDSRSIGIPVRMSNGAPGNRACTFDFKITVVDRWLRQHDAKKEGAQVGIGISVDEVERAKPNMDKKTLIWKENTHPLLFEVPRPLSRQDCVNVIAQAGLPIPPKSSCWFCPFHSLAKWQEMRKDEPALFQKAVHLESLINERLASRGKDSVWLTRKLIPLTHATTDMEQPNLFSSSNEDEECEGYCFL